MSAPGRRKRRGLQVGLSLLAIVILGWTLFPVYYMLLLSFTPTDDLFQPGLYVEHPTVRNYTYTMGADNPFVRYFWHQIGNSLVVALWAMALVAAVAALGSFAMARLHFRFRRFVSGLTLFTYVIPSSFLSIPFFKMMADYDLIDTKLSLILAMVTFASPYALWVLSDYARSLPPEIEEAGAIDGAGTIATFLYLYLPLIRPPLIAIGTYAFLYAWNEYLYAQLLLTGEPRITLPVAMGNFLTTDNAPWNLLMATSSSAIWRAGSARTPSPGPDSSRERQHRAMDAADDVGHASVVERVRRVARRVIPVVAVEGRVGDHHRRVALGPVAPVVREVDARDPGRRVHGIDVEVRRVLHRPLDPPRQLGLAEAADDGDEVAGRRIDDAQQWMRQPLAARRVAEVPDHLERDHRAHGHALPAQRGGVDVAAHPLGVVVRRLLKGEGDEIDARRRCPAGAEQARKLEEPRDTARVVVGGGERPGAVVVRADDHPLAGLGTERADDVAIPPRGLDGVHLLGHAGAGLAEPRGHVRRGAVEVVLALPVAGGKRLGEHADVRLEPHRIDPVRPRTGRAPADRLHHVHEPAGQGGQEDRGRHQHLADDGRRPRHEAILACRAGPARLNPGRVRRSLADGDNLDAGARENRAERAVVSRRPHEPDLGNTSEGRPRCLARARSTSPARVPTSVFPCVRSRSRAASRPSCSTTRAAPTPIPTPGPTSSAGCRRCGCRGCAAVAMSRSCPARPRSTAASATRTRCSAAFASRACAGRCARARARS